MTSLRAVLLAFLAMAAGLPAAAMPVTFGISPTSTDIGFAIDVLGLTTASGEFRDFSGSLTLDMEHPELSKVSIRIDTNSAYMGWEPAESMVAGEGYLDIEHYPEIRFVSHLVTMTGKGKVRMEGMLTLRGVSHWETFEAELVDRSFDAERRLDRFVFAAVGTVHRSDYQMDGGRTFLDDRVTFTIRTRLLLSPAPTP
jgi:polyisoprenoid-binding protein YceI